MNYIETIKIVSSIIISFAGAYMASVLALSKFKKEKYWADKRDAYNSVFTALEEIKYWAEGTRAIHCCEYTNSTPADLDGALRKITRYSETGALLFASNFYDMLKEVNSKIDKSCYEAHEESMGLSEREASDCLFKHAVEIRDVIDEYFPKLINTAKKEFPKKT